MTLLFLIPAVIIFLVFYINEQCEVRNEPMEVNEPISTSKKKKIT